ncbi:hypothetical protein D3C76_1080830 [compost metagenome]
MIQVTLLKKLQNLNSFALLRNCAIDVLRNCAIIHFCPVGAFFSSIKFLLILYVSTFLILYVCKFLNFYVSKFVHFCSVEPSYQGSSNPFNFYSVGAFLSSIKFLLTSLKKMIRLTLRRASTE